MAARVENLEEKITLQILWGIYSFLEFGPSEL
jgi:hypothetical protein